MRAVVYDEESYPNIYTLTACTFGKPEEMFTWEISDRKNDVIPLVEWLNYLRYEKIPMIGFNNLGYDGELVQAILTNEAVTSEQLYEVTRQIVELDTRRPVWPDQRLVPQIDLYKIHHFDNKAKRQSLKGLEFNMRSPNVGDLPFNPGTYLNDAEKDVLIEYNREDVIETNRFAEFSMDQIELRQEMLDSGMLSGDVMNFNDTKLGKELLIQRLGENICYKRVNGRREPNQTIRTRIPLKDVIFPYIQFRHPEFNRVLNWLLERDLGPQDFDGIERVSTKGVFKGLTACIDGFEFHFGTGGIHGSVSREKFFADEENEIADADIKSQYPSVGIVNKLYPEHLGQAFVVEYAGMKEERFKHAKGTNPNQALKLGLNGSYGDTNNIFSPLYDPLYTMRITINGQLLICMLVDALIYAIPELKMLQANTDGITVLIPRSKRHIYDDICKQWERFTMLDLEFVNYSAMFLRDVNSYIAVDAEKGKVKAKGAYWNPNFTGTPKEYADSITYAGPSAWHKDLSSPIIAHAAKKQMIDGVPVEETIFSCIDPFAFCIRAKVGRKDKLYIGDERQQRVTRYHAALRGSEMYKISPPVQGKQIGAFKKASGVSDYEYNKYDPFTWNELVHTKNKGTYQNRKTSIISGRLVAECNNITKFDWLNLDYDYYISEAKKLLI